MLKSKRKLSRLMKEYHEDHKPCDDHLYALCRKYPKHRSRGQIDAKICIIGRAYATQIERLVPTTGKQSSAIKTLVGRFYRNRRSIDALFLKLRGVREPLNKAKLKTIIRIHGRLSKIVGKATRKGRSSHAFVAKYMHFHCPAVPIYDSLAEKHLKKELKWRKEYQLVRRSNLIDKKYARFAETFLQLYSDYNSRGKPRVSVKMLDYIVLQPAR